MKEYSALIQVKIKAASKDDAEEIFEMFFERGYTGLENHLEVDGDYTFESDGLSESK